MTVAEYSRRCHVPHALFFALSLAATIVYGLACGVPAAKHAANVAESGEYAAQLAQCLDSAKHADAGEQKAAYKQCACGVDKAHGVQTPGC